MTAHKHKVLVVHNTYQHQGGEDSVVDSELALLRDNGHEVVAYRRHNDEIDRSRPLALAAQTLWSQRTGTEVGALLARERPDIVHVHNTLPLISPSVYWACAKVGVPVVQTLHNFRLACPQAMFLREGRVCEKCVGRTPWPAVVHGCYRGSRAQTAVVAATVGVHRVLGTWQHKVARYIALNAFCRDRFVAAGLPAERVVVKPNFVRAPDVSSGPRHGFLFVGRLSPEKGVAILAEAACRMPALDCKVVGTGQEAARLQGIANITSLGALAPALVFAQMRQARALVFPSLWYETFGLVIVEAFANGTPVIASRIGVAPDLVQEGKTGLLFNPGDAHDLARAMQWAEAHPEEMAAMGQRARAVYETSYSPERNYGLLSGIYDAALSDVGPSGGLGWSSQRTQERLS